MILASASMSAVSEVGGDSRVVSRYAVRRRSVARSSNEAKTAALGDAVFDGDMDARASVTNLLVHYSPQLARTLNKMFRGH